MTPLPVPPLLVISDRSQAHRPLVEIAAAVFAGGCRWFSLREKDLPNAERRVLLAEIVALGQAWGAVVSAHDDLEAVAALDAGGVHLPGGADPAAARARLLHGLVGISAHSPGEVAALFAAGADYVTLSPIFPSPSKPGYGPVLGLATLAAAAAVAPGPVIALGGIAAGNAASCLAAGAQGVAAMGGIMAAADPELAVRCLLRALAAGPARG